MVYSEYRWGYRLIDLYLAVNRSKLYLGIVKAVCTSSMINSAYMYQSAGIS